MTFQCLSVDLNTNEIRMVAKVAPQVAELVLVLTEAGGAIETDALIRKLWGIAEPIDAADSLSTLARKARSLGIPVWTQKRRGGGYYRLGRCDKKKGKCANGHEFTEDNTYQHGGRSQCRACRKDANIRARDKRRKESAALGCRDECNLAHDGAWS